MRLLAPRTVAYAHCDLPCGVYDPAQAKIEAESVKAICEKYRANSDPEFRTRALIIKEARAELVKHHLWVLWTDYFKAPHFEKYPNLHQLFNDATKLAGPPAPRARPTRPRPMSCSRRSRRSRRSSGRPSRRERRTTTSMNETQFEIRPARPEDVPAVVSMVHELAEYERAPGRCHITDEQPARGPVRPPRPSSGMSRPAGRSCWGSPCGS